MKLHFIRHGQSEANAAKIIAGQRIDSPLTALGITQAQASASAVAALNIDYIVSSPLKRAYDTAVIIANITSFDSKAIIVNPDLTEQDAGSFTGMATSAWRRKYNYDDSAGVETLPRLRQRAEKALAGASSLNGNILLVSHNRFGRMLRVTAEGRSTEDFFKTPGFLNGKVFLFEPALKLVHTKKGRY